MNEPTCDIDDPARKASAAVSSSAAAALAHIHPRVSRLCVTPLDGPVLPEVKKIAAGADGSGAGDGARGAAARSDSKRAPPGPGPSYQTIPRGSPPARRLAATSCARSAWTRSADASLTSSAWSISLAV